MIIDKVKLTGKRAYLQGTNGEVDIISTTNNVATTDKVVEGEVLELNSIQLAFNIADFNKSLMRADKPICSFTFSKEMFPKLFADPYRNRVHQIGGHEDFARGFKQNLKVMDVSGIPTLVATGTGRSRWISARYKLAEPMRLSKAAWGLAISRLAEEGSFNYEINLEVWSPGENPETQNGSIIVLAAANTKPDHSRMNEKLTYQSGAVFNDQVSAYRLIFSAEVSHDADIEEFHVGSNTESLGSPLLQAIYLLEDIESSMDFYSLAELFAAANDYHIIDPEKPDQILLRLDLSARLNTYERLEVVVAKEAFKYIEAYIDGAVSLRPPKIDKGIA